MSMYGKNKKKILCRNPFLSRTGFDTFIVWINTKHLNSRNPFLSRAGFDNFKFRVDKSASGVSRNPFLSRAGFDIVM